MTKETIYETYIRNICSNCKNRKLDLCNIRKNIKGNLQCCYYYREKKQKGFKQFQGRTANQSKPIMKNIIK